MKKCYEEMPSWSKFTLKKRPEECLATQERNKHQRDSFLLSIKKKNLLEDKARHGRIIVSTNIFKSKQNQFILAVPW